MTKKTTVKEFDFMLPAPQGCCPVCAHKHPETYPHNATTLFYKIKFQREHKRWPTWNDAMSHCTPEMQKLWREGLKKQGVEIE